MQTQAALASTTPAFPFFNQTQMSPATMRVGATPLDTIGSVISVRSGREVYAEGDEATHWYKVTAGVLRTCKLLPDGRRQIDDFLFEGDVFGLEGTSEHCFAAEAVTNASVVSYSRSRFDAIAAGDARVSAGLLQMTLKRLDRAHKRLLLLGRKTAEEKLATFLLEMLDRADESGVIALPMSRTDIADYLGLTIETVSRTFSIFKRDGLVALPNAHTVVVRDRSGLEEISGDE